MSASGSHVSNNVNWNCFPCLNENALGPEGSLLLCAWVVGGIVRGSKQSARDIQIWWFRRQELGSRNFLRTLPQPWDWPSHHLATESNAETPSHPEYHEILMSTFFGVYALWFTVFFLLSKEGVPIGQWHYPSIKNNLNLSSHQKRWHSIVDCKSPVILSSRW